MVRGEARRDVAPHRVADDDRTVGAGVVQHGDQVLDMHGEVQNFASLLRCSCLLYVADVRPKAVPLVPPAGLHLVAAE